MYEDLTVTDIQKSMLQKAQEKGLSIIDGSFASTIMAPVAYEIWKRYQEINTFADLMTMETSDGEWIEKKCADFGITRKEGAQSIGELTFYGSDGTRIYSGTLCKDANGRKFRVADSGTISEGEITLPATSVDIGLEQNVSANTITYFADEPIEGVTVVNETAFTGGADLESDDSLKNRFYERVRKAAASGNAEDYKVWAQEIPEVENAKVIPLWAGAGTVKVVLFGKDNTEVSEQGVGLAAEYIDSKRPIGASVTVVSCDSVDISVTAEVELSDLYDLEMITAQATAAITKYFGEDFEGDKIYISRILQIIMDCGGVINCAALELNGDTEDIEILAEEVPKLLSITLTEVS